MTTHSRNPSLRYPASAPRFDDDGVPEFFQLTPGQYDMLVREVLSLRAEAPYDRLRREWKLAQRQWCGDRPSRRMLVAVRQAVQRGHAWALTAEQYAELTAQPCHSCGGSTGSSCGLDRIDNALGYMDGNVRPCCGPCNVARQRGG